MRLKKLKIVGFKSFADKVAIDFDRDIIGVVGPNGCGKSNIVDAFRWVLGEQSAKSMRAGGMQDVLFAGTTKRAPLNFAEVAITLSDVGETLNTPYEEVTITRRLYRDGDSEYLLNREPVRLRDIHHLLLGSGIGKNAFSIFEQGRIDRVIHLAPTARRSIFDEAAGIGLFLEKKKETVKKLSAATENFNRIRDIHSEVAKQAATLKRQATLAQTFKENQARLEQLEKAVLATKMRLVTQQSSDRDKELLALQEEQRLILGEIETLALEFSKQKELLAVEEKDAATKRERLYQAEKSFEVQSVEIRRAKERLGELELQLRSLHDEKRHFKSHQVIEKDEKLEEELAALEKQLVALTEEKEELERLQLEAAKAHEARFLEEEIEKKSAALLELKSEIASKEEKGQQLKLEAAVLKEKWQSIASEMKQKKKEIDLLHRQIAEFNVRMRMGSHKLLQAFPHLKPLLDSIKPKKGCEALLHTYSDTLLVNPNQLDEILAYAKKEGIENFSLLPTLEKKLSDHFVVPIKERAEKLSVTPDGLYMDYFGVLFQTPQESRVKIKQKREEAEEALKKLEATLIDPSSFEEKWRKKEMVLVQENFYLQECLTRLRNEEKALEKLQKKLSLLGKTAVVQTQEERLTQLKEELPKVRESVQSKRTMWHHSERERAAANAKRQAQEERAVKVEHEIAECEKHRILCEKMIQTRSGSIEGLEAELSLLRTQSEKQHETLESLRKKQATLEEKLGKKRGRSHTLSEKIHKLEVASAAQNTAREELEKALEGVSWNEIESVDLPEAEREIRTLRVTIEKSSQVNLLAIDEYAESEKRATHLKEQYEDIEKAKKELEKIILKLDQESRKIFKETFEKVRANFQKNFAILFRGGEADLRFTDSSDVLEAGIDIMARPPGKKLRSISLLSGGEKCLTALALLFAIFEVRRAPFCILDEVDAPLDESNIDRFCEMLRQFTDQTQFIIVTHNKKTMAIADILIGVSMEEKGVSKLLSLQFAERQMELVS